MRKKVLVLGSNFGGLTAALAVKHELHGDVDVTVISPSDLFVFNPSLIWLPFGKRSPQDLSFPVTPTLEHHGIEFVHHAAESIDSTARTVSAGGQSYPYDYLVIATGYRNDFDVAPGLGPGGNAVTITTLEDAVHAGERWKALLDDPGPVVVAATQRASCFGAAYEFLFNAAYHLKRAKLKGKVPLTYVTSEPFLGHFGIGGLPHGEQLLGMFLKMEGITAITDASIEYVDTDVVHLQDGQDVPMRYSMVIPPFLGQQVVKDSGLSDARGYVSVRPTYQSMDHDDIYAVGIAAAVTVPWQTSTPVGIPKTGFPTETMAHVAASNIASQVRGVEPKEKKEFKDIMAVCVMDAGNNGVIILADKMLPPRKHGVLIPGPQAHAMKVAFEKYFLWKARNGYVQLP
jgi:sulfide:quinone oxidoreductase